MRINRLVEKFAEDMTMQDFIDAAEDQRERTLRERARMMAAFMNHDGAGEQTTLGEILDRDRVWRSWPPVKEVTTGSGCTIHPTAEKMSSLKFV
jgi:hypothetical protein